MSAESLTRDLGGKWFGGYGSCATAYEGVED